MVLHRLVGSYCEYMESGSARTALNDCGTFQEYLDGLTRSGCPPLDSDNFTSGFTWTPDETTPNTVYYQVYYIYRKYDSIAY